MKTNNTDAFKGKVRIIGGHWRGRKLLVPNKQSLRPTTDRVRETLFNWLAPVIQGAHCLDCFAGSGALGIEALSRGAFSVVLVEQDHAISTKLTKNLKIFQAQNSQVITADSLQWLARPGITFNVVFIDPPFRKNMIRNTIVTLERYHRLVDNAWIYIETERECTSLEVPIYWQLYRKKTAGKVVYRLYIRRPSSNQRY